MFLIASILSSEVIMPCLVIQNPRYSSSFLAKEDFSAFTLKPFWFNLLSIMSNLLM